MNQSAFSSHLKKFYDEMKIFFAIYSSMNESQIKFFDLVNNKFLEIDSVIQNILTTPSILNNKQLKNIQIFSSTTSNYYKHSKELKHSFELKSIQDVENNMETHFTSLINCLTSSEKSRINTKKTVFSIKNPGETHKNNLISSEENKTPPKNQNNESFLLKNNYTNMIIKKMKNSSNGCFSIFDKIESKNSSQNNKKVNVDNYQTKKFLSISSLDPDIHSYLKPKVSKNNVFFYYSEKIKENCKKKIKESKEFDIKKEDLNYDYATPQKNNKISENIECDVEDTQTNHISKPFLGNKILSTSHNVIKSYVTDSPIKEKQIIQNLMRKQYKNLEQHPNYHHCNLI